MRTVFDQREDTRERTMVARYFAGFDIGGTKTMAIVIDEHGTPINEIRVPRPVGPEDTLDQLCGLVERLGHEAGAPLDGVGIGIAGAISREGSVQFSPNLPELVDFPLRKLLTDCLDVPIMVDNDATAATWAEHQLGAGRGVDHLLYAALGTGIGTGFVLDGSIYRGANGFAGEAGHIVIDRNGDTHISGVRGPWELFASGNGLGALARSTARTNGLDKVVEFAGSIDAVRGEHVGKAIDDGDLKALSVLDEFARYVAIGLTNLIYVLDPERIVIGGGLAELGSPLQQAVQREVDATTLGGAYRPAVPVVLAELGARSAALGAAMLAQASAH